VAELRPFLVTSWFGHRNDPDLPQPVREVWSRKFRSGRPQQATRQSNVDFALLDSRGKLVAWFDAVGSIRYGRPGDLIENTVTQLRRAALILGLPSPPRTPRAAPPLKLPEPTPGNRGLRIFVRLDDRRMPAYRLPVVEVVDMAKSDWSALAWPDDTRTVDAAKLKKWLTEVYPPGVMERVDRDTKKVFSITGVSGKLSLVPSASSEHLRYAVASGRVRLSDSGVDGFSYEGTLELVMTYTKDSPDVISMRGFFRGSYPRHDRTGQTTRWIPLEAVFESRPK